MKGCTTRRTWRREERVKKQSGSEQRRNNNVLRAARVLPRLRRAHGRAGVAVHRDEHVAVRPAAGARRVCVCGADHALQVVQNGGERPRNCKRVRAIQGASFQCGLAASSRTVRRRAVEVPVAAGVEKRLVGLIHVCAPVRELGDDRFKHKGAASGRRVGCQRVPPKARVGLGRAAVNLVDKGAGCAGKQTC